MGNSCQVPMDGSEIPVSSVWAFRTVYRHFCDSVRSGVIWLLTNSKSWKKLCALLAFWLVCWAVMDCSRLSAAIIRVPNTTLTLPASPPSFGYAVTNAFGNLSFMWPVAIVTPPGETNRLFVVEQQGRIAVITNLASPTRTVFIDLTARLFHQPLFLRVVHHERHSP
jgi:hypothetical protein